MADDTSYICTVSHTDKIRGKFLAGTTYTRDQMPEEFGKHYFKTVPKGEPVEPPGDPAPKKSTKVKG